MVANYQDSRENRNARVNRLVVGGIQLSTANRSNNSRIAKNLRYVRGFRYLNQLK